MSSICHFLNLFLVCSQGTCIYGAVAKDLMQFTSGNSLSIRRHCMQDFTLLTNLIWRPTWPPKRCMMHAVEKLFGKTLCFSLCYSHLIVCFSLTVNCYPIILHKSKIQTDKENTAIMFIKL